MRLLKGLQCYHFSFSRSSCSFPAPRSPFPVPVLRSQFPVSRSLFPNFLYNHYILISFQYTLSKWMWSISLQSELKALIYSVPSDQAIKFCFCLITHRQRIEVLNSKSKGQLPRSTSSYLCSCHEVLPVIKPVECLGFTMQNSSCRKCLCHGWTRCQFVLDIDFH